MVTETSETETTETEPSATVTSPTSTEPAETGSSTVPSESSVSTNSTSANSSTTSQNRPAAVSYGYTTASQEQLFDAVINAADGDTVTINLTGNTKIDKNIFEEIYGRNVTVEFRLSGGAYWTINGMDIENPRSADLGVRINNNAVSKDKIKDFAGSKKTVQFTLKHNGKFGFKGILNIPVNKKYNGKYANLYYYNKGEFEYMGYSLIENNYAKFAFNHASDYVIVIDDYPYAEDVSSAAGAISDSNAIDEKDFSKSVLCIIAAFGGAGVYFRKKRNAK